MTENKDNQVTSIPEYTIDQAHIDELLKIKDRVESIYRGKNRIQIVNGGDYPLQTSCLGKCGVYHHGDEILYSIHHGQIAPPPPGGDVSLVDFIIIMHEIGHITLGHMNDDQDRDDSPFQLIRELYDTIVNDGAMLAEQIAKSCGIEVELAEQLLTRLMDDPDLLHELLNISMDMSVNTCILNDNDIHYIEQEITRKFKRLNMFDTRKEKLVSNLEDMATEEYQKETKERLRKELERLRRRVMLKFILPANYKLGVDELGQDIPFPNGKTYYEYFRLIVDHLDQFVKFLASLRLGKPMDELSSQDLSNELKQEQEEFEYKKGYRQANVDYQERLAGKSNRTVKDYPQESEQFINGYNQSIEDIAKALLDQENNGQQGQNGDGGGFEQETNGEGQSQQSNGSDGQGEGEDDSQGEGSGEDGEDEENTDHNTPSLGEYLKDMQDSTIGDPDNPKNIRNRGGNGRSTQEIPSVFRQVKQELDPLDQFLVKLGRDHRKTVVSIKPRRDIMYRHNRRMGSGRGKVIIPSIQMKLEKNNTPRVVFLIDISGSMDVDLIDRVLKTISISLKKISTSVRYDVITWNTSLAKHYKDLDPRKPLTSFPCDGGTALAYGIQYFGLHYDKDSPLVIISDFCDDLDDWNTECNKLQGYKLFGINYGGRRSNIKWGNFTEFKF
jgi:hypothetical protein